MRLLMMVSTRIWKRNSMRTRIRNRFSIMSRISKTIRRNETQDWHSADQDLTIRTRKRGT